MCCASTVYSGRLIRREIRLATMADAISVKTSERPSIISMTMMNDVSGACVTAARNPAMPMAISTGASELPAPAPVSCAMSWPMPAPIESDGAKMPPGTPHQVVIQVASSLSSA